MRKPLLTAKELESVKDFPVDNLTLIPKLVDFALHLKQTNENERSIISSYKPALLAELKHSKVLNKNQAAVSRPIYYYDFAVTVPETESFSYQPGDSFGFYPKLSAEEVDFIAEKVQVSPSRTVHLTGPLEILAAYFPQHQIEESGLIIKVSDLISRLDVRSFPKKATLRTVAEYCQDEQESTALLFLSSRNGSDAYNRLRSELLSIQILLAAFDSINLPLEALVNLAGPLQPRYYSACRKQEGNSFQIVFNVSETSIESSEIKGVCSSWLESLNGQSCSATLPIIQRSISHFRLPSPLTSRPIIMIAAGTGLAPFIGFLEVLQSQPVKPFTWLIFGYRSHQDDFIFEEELKEFQSSGILSRLALAASRDSVEPKTYVQDVIRKEKDEFYHLLQDEDALVYVCGDELTMIKGINDAIVELIMERTAVTKKEADGLLLQWTRDKKIIRDIWV